MTADEWRYVADCLRRASRMSWASANGPEPMWKTRDFTFTMVQRLARAAEQVDQYAVRIGDDLT